MSILAELSFTLYTDVTDIFNLLGHLYKFVALGLVYRAVFVGSVKEPFERALHAERKAHAASLALQRQHALLSKIIETSPIGITLWDASGKITFANAEAEKVLGRTKEEIMRLAYNDPVWRITDYGGHAMPDGDLPFQRVVASGAPVYNAQMALHGDGGKRILLSVNASPLLGADGRIDGVVATLDDITQRKAAEDMLRTSEARLKIVMDAAHMGTWTWDVVNDRVRYAPEYSVLMGLPRGESHPDRAAVLAAIHPGDRKRLDAALRQALVKERSHWMDFRVFWPDGSLHWLSALELELIKTHAQAGYDILKDIRFPWPIARIVLEHHERLDGSGYPNGLRGGQILRESKILTVADVVEAMTSHRPYRPGLGLEVALEHIASHRGDWYEPEVVDVCLRLFRESRHSFG